MSLPLSGGSSQAGWYAQEDNAAARSAELSHALEHRTQPDQEPTARRGLIHRVVARLRHRR